MECEVKPPVPYVESLVFWGKQRAVYACLASANYPAHSLYLGRAIVVAIWEIRAYSEL